MNGRFFTHVEAPPARQCVSDGNPKYTTTKLKAACRANIIF
jgi:hypothetical protein